MWETIFDLSAWAILIFYAVVVLLTIGLWIWMTCRSWKKKDISDRWSSSSKRSSTKMHGGGAG